MGENRRVIYLDNFTLALPTSRVKEAYERANQEAVYDITAPYANNHTLVSAIETSIQYLYELVGASPEDRFFYGTSEASLSAEIFLSVFIEEMYKTGKNHLIAPKTEKASILRTMEKLKEIGCTITLIDVDQEGQVTLEAVKKQINPKTAMIALSWVDGLLGTVRPIWEITEYCKEQGILTYVQASEIFAKLFFRFKDLPIDYLTFSGELFHAPKGSAGMFVKKGRKAPVISYPLGSRLATFEGAHPAGLVAMGEAACEVLDLMDSMSMEVAHLRAKLENLLEKRIEQLHFFGKKTSRVPNVSCFAIEGVHAELLLFHLQQEGVFATFGGGQRQKLDHVLAACQIDPYLAECAISIALSYQTTEEEIDELIEILVRVVKKLRVDRGALV